MWLVSNAASCAAELRCYSTVVHEGQIFILDYAYRGRGLGSCWGSGMALGLSSPPSLSESAAVNIKASSRLTTRAPFLIGSLDTLLSTGQCFYCSNTPDSTQQLLHKPDQVWWSKWRSALWHTVDSLRQKSCGDASLDQAQFEMTKLCCIPILRNHSCPISVPNFKSLCIW